VDRVVYVDPLDDMYPIHEITRYTFKYSLTSMDTSSSCCICMGTKICVWLYCIEVVGGGREVR
jgi:hypothetical protein